MKKRFLIVGLGAILFGSCVPLGKYEAIEYKNTQLRRELNTAQGELNDLKEENAERNRQIQSLETEIVDLNDRMVLSDSVNAALRQEMENMRMGFDTLIENYNQRITGQNQDLTRANTLLLARERELNEKEQAFRNKEQEFRAQETAFRTQEAAFRIQEAEMQRRQEEMQRRQTELERQSNATRQALEAKERELEQLRSSINNALVGFADKGLNVETRNGKVYVSMESKLMFPSASWQVSQEGIDAIRSLAKVLEQNTDLNIMVEGHTDNAAYRGSGGVKDNWDLSVMRATAIVKLLLQYGPGIDPSRIEACGHGEYAPRVSNDTPENRAMNRRTEIILTPRLNDILNLVEP
ncbi:MAG: OmpA family protein [Bacteroidales bacterium]|nr:OmpA family protein [Bacteroidales bacterium]